MLGLNNSQFHSMTKQLTLFLMFRFCTKHVIKCSVNKLMLIWPWRSAFAVHAFQMYYCWFITCVHYVHPQASLEVILEKYLHMPTFVSLKLDISSCYVIIYMGLQTEKPPETPREFSSALLWNIVSLLHNQRKLNRLDALLSNCQQGELMYCSTVFSMRRRAILESLLVPGKKVNSHSWSSLLLRQFQNHEQKHNDRFQNKTDSKPLPTPGLCIFIQKKQQRNKHVCMYPQWHHTSYYMNH